MKRYELASYVIFLQPVEYSSSQGKDPDSENKCTQHLCEKLSKLVEHERASKLSSSSELITSDANKQLSVDLTQLESIIEKTQKLNTASLKLQ